MPQSLRVVLWASLVFSIAASLMAGASLLMSIGVLKPAVSIAQRNADEIRQFILDNPTVVLESVQRHEEESQAIAEDEAEVALRQSKQELLRSASPVSGNPQGDVTLVEFFDYNCPYCRKAGPILDQATSADSGLRIVYKEWPILGPGSEFAARAALAAQKQGKYIEFHRALMSSGIKVDEASTLQIAATVGLDLEELKTDMESDAVKAELDRNYSLAEKLRITGTPVFVVGNEIVRGFVELPTLQQAIANSRKKTGD